MSVDSIEPNALKGLLDSRKKILILDVRQNEEFQIVHFENSILIPLMEIPSRIDEVRQLAGEEYAERVVVCRVGVRSEQAIKFLAQHGVTGLKNLRGGINAYAKEADTSFSPY